MVGQKENQDLDGSKRVYAVRSDVDLETRLDEFEPIIRGETTKTRNFRLKTKPVTTNTGEETEIYYVQERGLNLSQRVSNRAQTIKNAIGISFGIATAGLISVLGCGDYENPTITSFNNVGIETQAAPKQNTEAAVLEEELIPEENYGVWQWGDSMIDVQERMTQKAGSNGFVVVEILPPEFGTQIYDFVDQGKIKIDGTTYFIDEGVVSEQVPEDEQTGITNKKTRPLTWAEAKKTDFEIASPMINPVYRVARFESGLHNIDVQTEKHYRYTDTIKIQNNGDTRPIILIPKTNIVEAPTGNPTYADHPLQRLEVNWIDMVKLSMDTGDNRTYTEELPIGVDYHPELLTELEEKGILQSANTAGMIIKKIIDDINQKIGFQLYEIGPGAKHVLDVYVIEDIMPQGPSFLKMVPDSFGEYGWRWSLESVQIKLPPHALSDINSYLTAEHEFLAHGVGLPADNMAGLGPYLKNPQNSGIMSMNPYSALHDNPGEISKASYPEVCIIRTGMALEPGTKPENFRE